jgi:hypothetical protein
VAARHNSDAFAVAPLIDALGLDMASICRGGRADPAPDPSERRAPEPAGSRGICDFCCLVPAFVLDPAAMALALPAASRQGEPPLVASLPILWRAVWPPARAPPTLS